MKGSYVLLISISHPIPIKIGSLGKIEFQKGYYAYVGSALNSLEKRIQRHLSYEKKLYWHIDYLTIQSKIELIFIKENINKEECYIAKIFSIFGEGIHGFGSSDCSCPSHLFYFSEKNTIKTLAKKIGMKRYKVTKLR